VNAAYETMHQIGYRQLAGANISQTDGFIKWWWYAIRGPFCKASFDNSLVSFWCWCL